MPSEKRQILLRPSREIFNTVWWLAQEKGRSANEIATDLIEQGLKRLNIPLRDEPPPKPPLAELAEAKEPMNETTNSVSQMAGD
jgi:hypothetical protein